MSRGCCTKWSSRFFKGDDALSKECCMHTIYYTVYNSRVRSEGFRFCFGGLGVETCSLHAAFVSATVREQLSWGQYCRAYGQVWKSGHAWRFQTSRSLVSRCRRGTLWHIPTCFITCPKSFCVTGVIPLRRCQKMSCIFRCRRGTLETSIIIVRSTRSTSDVSHVACFLQIALSGLRQVVTTR